MEIRYVATQISELITWACFDKDGNILPIMPKEYQIFLDDQPMDGICHGASEEYGWVDILNITHEKPIEPEFQKYKTKNGNFSVHNWFQPINSEGYVRIIRGQIDVKRVYGEVKIVKREAETGV